MRVGVDLVEHKDIENRDERFIRRILTSFELSYFQTITNKKRRIEYLSSRFACKEAVFKCYKEELQISLSHTDHYSIAVVILPTCDDD